jgi:predicted enzyme related to lactoylglutathione lyase
MAAKATGIVAVRVLPSPVCISTTAPPSSASAAMTCSSYGHCPSVRRAASRASANDSARRARELGGSVVLEPFDVLDVGRMALVQDGTGAVVALWQPRRHAGAGLIGETGAMCWNELATTDTARAEAFYAGLLDWSADTREMGGIRYTTFARAGAPCGGMLPIHPGWGPVPPHWLVYFGVSDCDGQVALVQSLGGVVRVPPSDVPGVGRFAVVADPQGATFAMVQLER